MKRLREKQREKELINMTEILKKLLWFVRRCMRHIDAPQWRHYVRH